MRAVITSCTRPFIDLGTGIPRITNKKSRVSDSPEAGKQQPDCPESAHGLCVWSISNSTRHYQYVIVLPTSTSTRLWVLVSPCTSFNSTVRYTTKMYPVPVTVQGLCIQEYLVYTHGKVRYTTNMYKYYRLVLSIVLALSRGRLYPTVFSTWYLVRSVPQVQEVRTSISTRQIPVPECTVRLLMLWYWRVITFNGDFTCFWCLPKIDAEVYTTARCSGLLSPSLNIWVTEQGSPPVLE